MSRRGIGTWVITPRDGSTHFLEGHLLPDKTIAHSPHLLNVISGLCLVPNPCTPNQLSHLLHQVQNPSSTIPKALLHAHFSFSAMWYKSVAPPTHLYHHSVIKINMGGEEMAIFIGWSQKFRSEPKIFLCNNSFLRRHCQYQHGDHVP